MWEEYAIVDYYGTDVFFDFDTYAYRASIGYSAYNSSWLYKDERSTRYQIASFSADEIKQLTIGLGVGSSASLEQGNNRLLAGTLSNTGDSIIIERMPLWTPPNLILNVNGDTKEFDKGWVNINGELKEIDKMWTNINGELKEI